MAKKAKRQFKPEDKARAVDDYVSGRKSTAQIAAEFGCHPNLIYRWKAEAEAARRDERATEIEASGVRDPRDVKRILDLEDELEAYKKTVAEQTVLIDLLKKLDQSKSSQRESELIGLIRTTKNSGPKRRR
jgi:transposase-like protein